MTPALLLAVLAIAAAPASSAAEKSLRQEVDQQNDSLIHEHFNLTRRFSLKNDGPGFSLELLFPDNDERRIHLWTDATEGTAKLELLAPDGKVLLSWSGRSGEADLTDQLAPGSYRATLTTHGTGDRVVLFGVKGTVAQPCAVDASRVLDVPANASAGFHWPYLLYLPKKAGAGHLLVAPNNTGFVSEDVALLRASATCTIHQNAAVADALGSPLLVPLFPRPGTTDGTDNLYLHALTRAALEARQPPFRRVDLQLLQMTADARHKLGERGTPAEGKLLLTGFSASGSFVNRFAMLHPEAVLAVASASPGGWPLVPQSEFRGRPLPYPVGISDVDRLVGSRPSPEALREVRWLFLLGAQDDNDGVPHRDSFSAEDQALIFGLFGKTPVSRWKSAERLYRQAGMDARFRLYPRTGHEISAAMQADTVHFFEDALGEKK